MSKSLLAAVIVAGAAMLCGPSLSAQSTIKHPSVTEVGSCSSGLRGGGPDCPLDRRLLIDVRRSQGSPLELREAISIGAGMGGAFMLTPTEATAADSVLYAIVDVDRNASGEFRIGASIRSFRTPARDCSSVATGTLPDLGFGAYLASMTAQLVQCAQDARKEMKGM